MKDRIAGAPGQYSAVVTGGEYQKLQSGQPFAITLTRDDKPEVEGTPYNKASVLPDSLAERLCPNFEDPTPADAFAALADARVIAQGTSGNWTYRKWANGDAEVWGVQTLKYAYDTGIDVNSTLPFMFEGEPVVNVTQRCKYKKFGTTVLMYDYFKRLDDAGMEVAAILVLLRSDGDEKFSEDDTADVSVHIKGRWK